MRTPYDRLSKALIQDTLAIGGRVHPQHEVADEVQAVDAWFVPRRRDHPQLTARGLLGRMVTGQPPALLEPFHRTPELDEVRACVRKQLVIHAARLRQARRRESPRPPFPGLWIISAGRPKRVLREYVFKPMPEWPTGCWMRERADAVRLVVVSELPRERDTLLLRLMGAGAVLKEALAEVERLPEEAWEREVAIPNLLALRFKLPQDGSDEDRAFMLNTNGLYEEWLRTHRAEGKREGKKEGRKEGLRRDLRLVYEARLGPMPRKLRAIVEATDDQRRLKSWLRTVATGTAEEIASALTASA